MVFIRQPDGKKLFASGGPEGSVETGPWTRANTAFTLRSGGGSKELARLTVGSERCDPTGKNRRLGED